MKAPSEQERISQLIAAEKEKRAAMSAEELEKYDHAVLFGENTFCAVAENATYGK